jgi:AraC-like DNA-binding protein
MSHHFRDAASLCLTNVMFMSWRLSAVIEELREIPGFTALFVVQPAVSHGGPSVILDAADQQVVRSITDRMLAESGSKPAGYKAALRGLFIELVVLLCRARSAPPEAGDRLAVLVSRLQERLDDRWSLGRMANIVGCSIPSLSRHFRRLLGSSPMEYLIALRLARAKELLLYTDLSVTEIAFECGFSDGNYLARQFKRRLGVSPRDFRRGESAPVI